MESDMGYSDKCFALHFYGKRDAVLKFSKYRIPFFGGIFIIADRITRDVCGQRYPGNGSNQVCDGIG